LILGKVWPEPRSTAAGQRTADLLNVLSEAGWQLSFASPAQSGDFALDLGPYGATSHKVQVNDPAFDTWVNRLQPDIVIFDRFMTEEQFGWRVAEQCPDALRVLDSSDLHFLRTAREAQVKSGGPLQLKNSTALREIAAIYRSDLTLIISEFEMGVLEREFQVPRDLLAYWPFSVDLDENMPDFDQRENFIMIGSFLHAPNLDAAHWCQREIWAKIRDALPDAEMHLYGAYGERYAKELNDPRAGFFFKGRAPEAVGTMARYRLNLAPLRFGAGLKGKVFDGFQAGTPTIVTPVAAEGIFDHPEGANESADSFALAAIQLYSDANLWRARQAAERAICRERFAPSQWHPRLPQIFGRAFQERWARREANFTGRMLRHHFHRSNEFLSRWIVAKNRQ
jgi:glycosyltransferase involved in cell wall biosynthesis